MSAAGVAAAEQTTAGRVLGANDRVRFGLIGAGARGMEDLGLALRCTNVEAVAVADVYTRRFDAARKLVPNIKTYRDFRQLLDDKSIDAVLIVTPQHQHCLNFVPAMQAGKDVYQEKTMAFTPAHARRMKHAFQGSGRVVQIGMQMNSAPGFQKARELATKENMGTITALQAFHFRNSPYGGWMRAVPPDCDAEHVDWAFFKARMHVPDTMSVTMQQPEKALFTWNSMFGNAYFGEGYDLLFGNAATLIHDEEDNVALLPQRRRGAQAAAGTPATAPGHRRRVI